MRKHIVFTSNTVIFCILLDVEDRGVQKNILVSCFCFDIRRKPLIGGKKKTCECLKTVRRKCSDSTGTK
jgi:hypothetical protein